MKIEIYQKEATRTMANLGELVHDSIHMTVGMNTEVSAELLKPLSSSNFDVVNVKEEIGDLMWYVANYATLHKLSLTTDLYKRVIVKDAKEIVEDILVCIGELQDLDKKLFAYKKPYDANKQFGFFNHLNQLILQLCETLNFNIESILQLNIDKLKSRYPEKFNEENAINRNLDVERKILEQ